ncbi:MAG TPA: hypothetical protein VFA37_02470 [Gaiellaceae bacterium]|nr:hypothetical protein [Gaiellaceae bacterium]
MKWNKRGHVYAPDGNLWWAKAYAFPPTPYLLSDEVIRIFIGSCDEDTVGRIGYVDVAAANPLEIVGLAREPLLDIGRPGTFDDNGILPTSVIDAGDRLLMYYVGYQLGHRIKYFQFTGLAESTDGGESFHRVQETPVTDRSDHELVNRTSAFVELFEDRFRMWYVGGSEWTVVAGKPLPVYKLRYMESNDGIHWPAEGRIVLDFVDDDEHAFGRPWVVRRRGEPTRMLYSVRRRSNDYRIGLAESDDEVIWTRRDDAVGITVSDAGWDSEMVAYTSVLTWRDQTYLFYCGNERGKTGFGYAELEEW